MLKKITLYVFLFFSVLTVKAQEELILENPVDSLYREDQFYINISYSMMQNKPAGYTQNGYFSNLAFGFLRDFPLNKRRNFAIAPGFGYTYSHLKSNLLIVPNTLVNNISNNDSHFEILPRNKANTNNMRYHSIDVPFEVRWRTSTPESHKFFRIYAGVKFSYIFADKSVYKDGSTKYKVSKIDDLNRFQTGIYLSAGYNTWNAYAYYGLTPLFKESKTNTEPVKLNALHLGLIFYIL
jgi:hypothetical protein